MSAEEMVLDPWSFTREEHERAIPTPAAAPTAEPADPGDAVPPVRTIVLDRAPTPVRPGREREAVRDSASSAGPERLSIRDVTVAYAGKEAVKSVSLPVHKGEVLALIGPPGGGNTSLRRAL